MPDRMNFAGFVEKAVAREMAPLDHPVHPHEAVLLDGLAGTLDPDRRSYLTAHLATCALCRSRWDRLSAEVVEQTSRLEAQARVPSLSALARARRREHGLRAEPWPQRLKARVGSLVPRVSFRPAFAVLATAVATAAVTLVVTIPLLRAPAISTAQRVSGLTAQVAGLERQLAGLAGATSTIETRLLNVSEQVAGLPGAVSAGLASTGYTSSQSWPRHSGDLDQIAETARGLPDPTQQALYVVTALQRYGILNVSRFDWSDFSTYTTRPKEMWADIAAFALGGASLWPLVWVLNSDVGGPGDPLPGGIEIRVPSRAR